jgi:WD40 repeat protein
LLLIEKPKENQLTDPIQIDAHGKHEQAVLFSKEHTLLASAGLDTMIHLWSRPSFDRKASFTGHANSVNSLSLNPKEDLLASGPTDQTVRVWTFPEGNLAANAGETS